MQTIIFDFGNVVGFFDHHLTLNRLAAYSDMPPAEMYHAVYDGNLEDAFESGQFGTPEFLRKVRELCRLRCDEAFMEPAFADIFRPNPEVCDLIPKLVGRYRILLGSNTNPLHAGHFQKQFADVLAQFNDQVLSFRIGVRKPKAGFFQHCVELAKCPANECLFVDDMPSNIAGAKAVGLQGIVYKPGDGFSRKLESLGIQA